MVGNNYRKVETEFRCSKLRMADGKLSSLCREEGTYEMGPGDYLPYKVIIGKDEEENVFWINIGLDYYKVPKKTSVLFSFNIKKEKFNYKPSDIYVYFDVSSYSVSLKPEIRGKEEIEARGMDFGNIYRSLDEIIRKESKEGLEGIVVSLLSMVRDKVPPYVSQVIDLYTARYEKGKK